MIFIEKMKNMKIYKTQTFLPTVNGNKKKNSVITLLTPNYASSKKLMNHPLFVNKLRYASYYLERDISYYINDDTLEEATYNEEYSVYQLLTEISSEKRNSLKDSDFGIPSKRKFPLDTEKRVRSAIKFFNYVDKEDEEELASNIKKVMKKFDITDVQVGEKNRFKNYYNESVALTESLLKNEKDILYNKDKFESGEINLCFVTGHSGSGKSTLAHKKEKEKDVDAIELDDLLCIKDHFTMKQLKEYSDLIYSYFNGPGKKFYVGESDLRVTPEDQYEDILFRDFVHYAMKYSKSHKDKKYIIEGIWIFETDSKNKPYFEPNEFDDYAFYIKGTSMIISKYRAAKRDSWDSDTPKRTSLKNFVTKNWKWYRFNEKQLNKFRDYFKKRSETILQEGLFDKKLKFPLEVRFPISIEPTKAIKIAYELVDRTFKKYKFKTNKVKLEKFVEKDNKNFLDTDNTYTYGYGNRYIFAVYDEDYLNDYNEEIIKDFYKGVVTDFYKDLYKTAEKELGKYGYDIECDEGGIMLIKTGIKHTIKSIEELFKIINKNIKYSNYTKLKSFNRTWIEKSGSCHDQYILEDYLFKQMKIKHKGLFLIEGNKESNQYNGRTHSLLYYFDDGKIYWFENAWGGEQGIHGPYKNIKDLKQDVESKMLKDSKYNSVMFTNINTNKLKTGISLQEYVNTCMNIKESKDEPLDNEESLEKSDVLFLSNITPENIVKAYKHLGVSLPDKVACKVHSGEDGNQNYLRPELWSDLINYVNGTVVECNTAYEEARNTTEKHKELIKKHGWDQFDVDIMDEDFDFELPIEKYNVIDKNYVGSHMRNYSSMVVLSHFKGHSMGGFGGALKQLSIGCASSRGKKYIHGFGNADRGDQILADFKGEPTDTNEQLNFINAMADAASSVHNFFKDNIVYINIMSNMSVDCDCVAHAEDPCMKDIGILISKDPVAIDKACIDLVYNSNDPGKNHLIERIESRGGLHIFDACKNIDFGNTKYNLINLDAEESNDVSNEYANPDNIFSLIEKSNSKNVIFDLGGVLLEDQDWKELIKKTYPDLKNQEIGIFVRSYMDFLDKSDTASFNDARVAFMSTFDDPSMRAKAIRAFNVLVDTVKQYDYTVKLLQDLQRKGYKLYYLSNWSNYGFNAMKAHGKLDFLKYFNDGMVSYEVGFMKPDVEIFNLFLKKMNLKPEECIFFDDKVDNCRGAKASGMNAYVWHVSNSLNESYIIESKRNNKLLYHLSETNLDGKTLTPRTPDNYFTKNGYEDGKTKRVCFSGSITGALMALNRKYEGKEFYVHIAKDPDEKYCKKPTQKEVPDVKYTGEIWYLKPIEVKYYGKIKAIRAKEKPLKFKYGNNTAEQYEWEWEWIDKPVNESEDITIQESIDIKNFPLKSKYFDKKDNAYNIDKFISGERNILYVTGLSGSGKSTLSIDLANKYKAEYVELDFVMLYFMKKYKDKGKQMNVYNKMKSNCPDACKFLNKTNEMKYSGLIDWKSIHTLGQIARDFISWFEANYSGNGKKYVVCGSFIFEFVPYDFFIDRPIIIKQNNIYKTLYRRSKRELNTKDYANFKDWVEGIKKHIKMSQNLGYKASSKMVGVFSDRISNSITESKDKSDLDEDFKKKTDKKFKLIDINSKEALKYVDSKFQLDNKSGRLAICINDNKAAGFIYWNKSGNIAPLKVYEKYRGYGLSELLLKEAIDNGGKKLGVYKDNEVAINLYKKFGFKEESRKKYKDGDEVIMMKL